jgi:chemotaxis signal transduction protein
MTAPVTPMITPLRAMVCFRAGNVAYAIPVEHVREVRAGAEIVSLPAAQPGVVGLMNDDGVALTVIAPLGNDDGSGAVLLLEYDGRAFGLAVAEVTGVVTPTGWVGPPPAGQVGHFISGVVVMPEGLVLLVDVGALDESFR